MTIHHLFLGGGDVYGFAFFGLLREASRDGTWSIHDIRSIHGISAGAIVGTMIALGLDWDVLNDYLVHRPWDTLFHLNMYSVLNSIQNIGIFSTTEFYDIFRPLFSAQDLTCDITLLQFYEFTGIEHYYIVTKIDSTTNHIHYVTMSYKTHPEWKLLDVIYMSSCVPVLFRPFFYESDIYLDGIVGFRDNIIHQITQDTGCEITMETLLCVTLENETLPSVDASTASLFDYLLYCILCIVKPIFHDLVKDHPHNFKIRRMLFHIDRFHRVLSDPSERVRFIDLGKETYIRHRSTPPTLESTTTPSLISPPCCGSSLPDVSSL